MNRITLAIITAVIIVSSCMLLGCYVPPQANVNINRMEEVEVGSEGIFRYFEIDGMPCITRHDGHQGGLTCDWSKFDKSKFIKSGWIAK